MRVALFLLALMVASIALLAQTPANVVLLVTKETCEEITDDGILIVTNLTDRYVFATQPAFPQSAYRSARGGYATNTASAVISNDIAAEVGSYYRRLGATGDVIEVRMP